MMEKRKFRLGDYEFDTYEEYLEAQEDLKKIDLITEEVDINDVDVAARLYTRIRNKEIVFHSKVGINFFMYLSDIVANHSMLMVEEKKAQEDLKKKNRKQASTIFQNHENHALSGSQIHDAVHCIQSLFLCHS